MRHLSTQRAARDLASTGHTVSRQANPFATCWTRPGALPFHFDDGQSAKQLVAEFTAQQCCGAIVGPHGSGKSTLLETLKPTLREAGFRVHSIALKDRQRRLPADFWSLSHTPRTIIIVDGYEQLGWFERARLMHFCRRASRGLLVTTHSPTRILTLLCLAPNERLVQRLVGELAAQVSTPITISDIAASHACHGSNVREILFDLYDRHEQMRRTERTLAAADA